ncbi:MAG: DUF6339 family protein [Clostridium sp.]|nr:DUF6339 family protein [Clostridium sp.]
MLLQRTFYKNYAESLKDAVKNGLNLELYAKDSFDFDANQTAMIPNLAYPERLLEKLVPNTQGDFQSAVALYEAYPDLTPLQASDKSFWIYLAHVDLFPYVQKRFPKVKENGFDNKQYILDHWFFEQGPMLHSLSGIWWLTYLSVDEDGEDKYKYTKQIFRSYNMRSNFAKYRFVRHREAVFGYLQFMIDFPEIFKVYFRERHIFITKYFNKLGGSRLLSALPREYFYNELLNLKDQIIEVAAPSNKSTEIDEENQFFES